MNKNLKKRILEISYKYKLSHLGSNLTAVDIIDFIYRNKSKDDKFLLGQGHAGLALYVVLEKYYNLDAEEILKSGIHPERNEDFKIDFTTGSLGHALPAAVGMAVADRSKDVFVLESDGSMAEGSNWESLRIASELKLTNLHLFINANGYSAYGEVDIHKLSSRIESFRDNESFNLYFYNTNLKGFPDWIQGLNGHYVILDNQKYKEILQCLENIYTKN